MPCTHIYVSVCLVFVSDRIHAPNHTHPNPSAPICTHMYPSLPQIPSLPSSCLLLPSSMHGKTRPDKSFPPLFALFLLVSALINVYALILTHTHPCGVFHSCFFCFFTKHDVRGNFPGHGPQIRACETVNETFLSCFCVPRAHGPRHTHTHPFIVVYTCLNPFLPYVFMYTSII